MATLETETNGVALCRAGSFFEAVRTLRTQEKGAVSLFALCSAAGADTEKLRLSGRHSQQVATFPCWGVRTAPSS